MVTAQTDEIQVYDAVIAAPGVFNLMLHNNFTPNGMKAPAFPGGLIPDKSFNGVAEWAYGVTGWFRAGPLTAGECVAGKALADGRFAGAVAFATIALLVVGFHIPFLAQPGWIALVAGLLVAASLGLGLVIAAVSDSEAQAVQLTLLVLLASVFFSGFVLPVEDFIGPVRYLSYLLPVTHGIETLPQAMLRGSVTSPWMRAVLAGVGLVLFVPSLFRCGRVRSHAH